MNSTLKSLLIWLGLIVVIVAGWQIFQNFQKPDKEIALTEFISKVESGEIQEVTFTGNQINGSPKTTTTGTPSPTAQTYVTYAPAGLYYEGLANEFLKTQGVVIKAKSENTSAWTSILLNWAPIILMIGFWIFIMRQMQSGGNKALSFGKSRAKLSSSTQKKVTFKDVAGADEAKEELSGDHRVPPRAAEVPAARRAHPEGRAPDGVARHGQDAPRARGRGRSQRAVLLNLAARTSSRCSSASAPRACATSSSRARRTRRASSSSTRSTPSAAIAAPVSAAATTSASRR